ncbi:DUF6082 family protein [Streptomyces sp. 35G-GA-8]|uniref:DUF6082 family protein n=1 Tax=Streptomyces sp. 35G-GA-8 TaxID=2939434 RepID=UPI00201EFD8A|nr:DUF6082 family protein [Streptomyces sp. 35G-GA-8]MCL7376995.1 DUF6082 family protein [Streptomyces sp. 35G-GA-8]
MKIAHAVLVVAAVGAVRLAQAERNTQRRLALHAEEMHQKWISDMADDPQLQAIWTVSDNGVSTEEYTNLLHVNRQMSFLSAKFRAGLLTKRSLRVQARWLMDRDAARSYWQRFGAFRRDEAADRIDRTFNAIMADEYAVLADKETAGV